VPFSGASSGDLEHAAALEYVDMRGLELVIQLLEEHHIALDSRKGFQYFVIGNEPALAAAHHQRLGLFILVVRFALELRRELCGRGSLFDRFTLRAGVLSAAFELQP